MRILSIVFSLSFIVVAVAAWIKDPLSLAFLGGMGLIGVRK